MCARPAVTSQLSTLLSYLTSPMMGSQKVYVPLCCPCTGVLRLRSSATCLMMSSIVSTQYTSVTDRQTDTARQHIYTALCIYACGGYDCPPLGRSTNPGDVSIVGSLRQNEHSIQIHRKQTRTISREIHLIINNKGRSRIC